MKALFLTLQQAKQLADDLKEYSDFRDSSKRTLFKGFKVSFGDNLAQDLHGDESLEMVPIPEFTEISPDDDR